MIFSKNNYIIPLMFLVVAACSAFERDEPRMWYSSPVKDGEAPKREVIEIKKHENEDGDITQGISAASEYDEEEVLKAAEEKNPLLTPDEEQALEGIDEDAQNITESTKETPIFSDDNDAVSKTEDIQAEKIETKPKLTAPILNTDNKKSQVDDLARHPGQKPIIQPKEEVKNESEKKFQKLKLKPQPQGISYMAATVFFADGSSAISKKGMEKLRKVAETQKKHYAKILVVGHSSSRTRNMDIVEHMVANAEISFKRAQNIAKALRKLGVGKEYISIEAVSDSEPAYYEIMPSGEAMNRRAEIFIQY